MAELQLAPGWTRAQRNRFAVDTDLQIANKTHEHHLYIIYKIYPPPKKKETLISHNRPTANKTALMRASFTIKAAPPLSVVKCLWEVFVWRSCRARVCAGVGGVFSVGVSHVRVTCWLFYTRHSFVHSGIVHDLVLLCALNTFLIAPHLYSAVNSAQYVACPRPSLLPFNMRYW